MKGQAIRWTDEELAYIEANATLPRAELLRNFRFWFDRPEVNKSNLAALCKRKGWLTGRTGQFVKGQESHNKGKKGFAPPGSEKGWFKPGSRNGRAEDLYQPIGTERISRDGYRERKIHDGLPLQSRWRAVHLIEWEALNGPLPKGHALKCLDGDRANTDPSNWTCVPRAMLPRLNGINGRGYDQAPAEVKPTLMAITRLEHAAREKRKAKA